MSSKMKAICITAAKQIEIIDQNIPIPGPTDVLIKVATSMLCTWEQRVFLQIMPLPLPFVGGHEFAGEIVAIGSSLREEDFPIGSRCAAALTHNCGVCENCRRADGTRCKYTHDLEYVEGRSGLAEYVLADAKNTYLFPNDISYERIMFTEPLACVITGQDKFNIELGDNVVIQGAGIIGIMHAQVAMLKGAVVTIIERDEQRRQNALNMGICDHALNSEASDLWESVDKITRGKRFEIVINTVAIPSVIAQSIKLCSENGTYLMFGKVFPDEPIAIDINKIQSSNMKLAGTMASENRAFLRAAKILAAGKIKPETALLSELHPITNAQQAFENSLLPTTFRVGFKFFE